MNKKECKYKFSVVMPVYNTEKYLHESVESILRQDIGFKKNIQIIFVNDGSTDNSKEICLKYKEKYPENIVYIEQENSGVSSARNKGMKYVKGKYTNFLDSDDKWSLSAFRKVYDFFEKNKEKINLVACRQKFFEAREDYHILDYKFNEDKVVDILKEYSHIQLHITASFIKSDILKRYKFDEKLKYGEDSKFISEILLDSHCYGIISTVLHYYRKRNDLSSTVQNKGKDIEWYFTIPNKMYIELIEKSKITYRKVIKYIQFLIMYDIQYRLKENINDILSNKQQGDYRNIIKELLTYIDDDIICEQIMLPSEYKVYALSLKYGKNIAKDMQWIDNRLYFNNIEIYNLKNKHLLKINIIEIKKKYIEIEGEINCFIPIEDYTIYAKGKSIYHIEYLEDETNNREALGEIFLKNRRYKFKIPIHNEEEIRIMFKYKDKPAKRVTINLGKFARINCNSYKIQNNYIIRIRDNKILINKNNKKLHLKLEISYLIYLLKIGEYKVIIYRLLYFCFKRIMKKPIWIISDRATKAGDNGEVFFEYVYRKGYNKDKNVYFVIKSDSEDYKRLKKIGKVLRYDSIKYKLYFLLAINIISSQASDWIINAFDQKGEFISNLYKFKFIFLQHGIIKDDLSKLFRKYNKNIDIFVTSSKKEYNSIINGKYMYTEKEVKLTGLPRYDMLENKPVKKIIFMPTWRKSLRGKILKGASEYAYNEDFKDSEYYKFYQKLINDNRLIECMKKNGYIGKFFVHPIFQKQSKDFIGNDVIKVVEETDYNTEFKEAELLITDYSSVAFDFAYLNKPIIYIQFDKNEFFKQHSYEKGYFDYEKDGFGPIYYEYEDAIKDIIEVINNKCNQNEIYQKRAEEFFEFHDKNNCERVYREILKLSK